MKNETDSDNVLTSFQKKEIPLIQSANEKLRENLSQILKILQKLITDQEKSNRAYINALNEYVEFCKQAINDNITSEDIREMIIQHILTEDIFLKVFNDPQFHSENVIAKKLKKVVETFFTPELKKNLFMEIESFYRLIEATAAIITNHKEKQAFLKKIYENFYQAYNPKESDRLGIFYTPNEIVDFMITVTEHLLYQTFGKTLADKDIDILDPATGTGTFITEIIEHIPTTDLKYKYQNEIHCNEIAILPYYIASLNIEFTYKQKMKEYLEFKNICLVDTLENREFEQKTKQSTLPTSSGEVFNRIQQQNRKNISIIIGNPPYNANQMNVNQQNANREYTHIDAKIQQTYVKKSKATKTKSYDMYIRFLRWATDRLHSQGIIAFITNNAFINEKTHDGLRRCIVEEFDEVWVINLKGDARTRGLRRQNEGGNVFNDKIRCGIAITFFIKKNDTIKDKSNFDLYYYAIGDKMSSERKLNFIKKTPFDKIPFIKYTPSVKDPYWLPLETEDFEKGLLVGLPEHSRKAKKNATIIENTIFNFQGIGIATNRDLWVYDFNLNRLKNKVQFFITTYEACRNGRKSKDAEAIKAVCDLRIKWSRDLKQNLENNDRIEYEEHKFIQSHYKPFIKKHYYAGAFLSDILTENHKKIFGDDLKQENQVIILTMPSKNEFKVFCSNIPVDLHFLGDACTLPLYTYSNKNKTNNISDFAIQIFSRAYPNIHITKEDIFYYVYAVLIHPNYEKINSEALNRNFPRIQLYRNFSKWEAWGKKLANLHLNYDNVPPYMLGRNDSIIDPKAYRPILKRNKSSHSIIIDNESTLTRVPVEIDQYLIRGKSNPIDLILEYYRYKKPNYPEFPEEYDQYDLKAMKENLILLLRKVITVCIQTVEIFREMDQDYQEKTDNSTNFQSK